MRVLLMICTAMIVACDEPVSPSQRPFDLSFERERDVPGFLIYVTDTTRAAPRLLFSSAQPAFQHDWSPDGRYIAFTRRFIELHSSRYELFTRDTRTNSERALTHADEEASFAKWSPDGRRIAYLGPLDAGTGVLSIINTDGSGLRRVGGRDIFASIGMSWSPDGRRMAGTRRIGTAYQIVVVDVNTAAIIALTNVADTDSQSPAWSPDGSTIAYMRGDAIYLMDATGLNPRELVARGSEPAWSPDGKQIAFTLRGDSEHGIYVVNRDGSGVKRVTDDRFDRRPSWRPRR